MLNHTLDGLPLCLPFFFLKEKIGQGAHNFKRNQAWACLSNEVS